VWSYTFTPPIRLQVWCLGKHRDNFTLKNFFGVQFLAGAGNFSLRHRVQTGSGADSASYPVGTKGSFPGVKRPGRAADHSHPSSAEVKNAWSYNSTPPVRLHGVVLS
jgi:hypothetical protein